MLLLLPTSARHAKNWYLRRVEPVTEPRLPPAPDRSATLTGQRKRAEGLRRRELRATCMNYLESTLASWGMFV